MENADKGRTDTREEPLNPGAVRRALAGLWFAVLAVAILFAMFVVAENRNLRAQVGKQQNALQQLDQVRQQLTACLNELNGAYGGEDDFKRIVRKHFSGPQPASAPAGPPEPGGTPPRSPLSPTSNVPASPPAEAR